MRAVSFRRAVVTTMAGLAWLSLNACSRDSAPKEGEAEAIVRRATAALPTPNPDRNAYFGAVHVHTGWSFDALTNGSKTTPSDAYAWAQGREITNSGVGGKIQIQTPLDFYMVSDHAEYMGAFNQMSNPDSPLSKSKLAKGVSDSSSGATSRNWRRSNRAWRTFTRRRSRTHWVGWMSCGVSRAVTRDCSHSPPGVSYCSLSKP